MSVKCEPGCWHRPRRKGRSCTQTPPQKKSPPGAQTTRQATPAQQAGLDAGDLVLAVDGAKVTTLEQFYKKLWDRATPDAEIKLTVLQGADVNTIVLKAQDRLLTLKKPDGI